MFVLASNPPAAGTTKWRHKRAVSAWQNSASTAIRFKILLPLFDNDGTPIKSEKFLTTDDDRVATFGATSTDQVSVRSRWKYQSTVYSDQLIRVRVDVEETSANRDAMQALKETLKLRFDQLDIWITSHRIDVI